MVGRSEWVLDLSRRNTHGIQVKNVIKNTYKRHPRNLDNESEGQLQRKKVIPAGYVIFNLLNKSILDYA